MNNAITRWTRFGIALTIALVLIGRASAAAQVRVATFDELRRALDPGDVISVVQTTGDSVRGRLLRLGDADLEVRAVEGTRSSQPPRGDIRIPLSAVQAVERRRDSSRNGAVIGAGIGAGVAGAMFVYAAAVDRNEIDEWAPLYLGSGALFTAVGALVGWAIDSAHSKPHVRFDGRSSEPVKVKLAPLLSRRLGAAVVVSY
jgi:hypothetical protein